MLKEARQLELQYHCLLASVTATGGVEASRGKGGLTARMNRCDQTAIHLMPASGATSRHKFVKERLLLNYILQRFAFYCNCCFVASTVGLEPTTQGFKILCSNQLS